MIEEKIKKSLKKIQPMLQADGGDIEFVAWDEKTGVVEVKLLGMCSHCPMAQTTLEQGVQVQLMKDVKEVKRVIGV